MAVLQPADYSELRDRVYRAGSGKEELKARPSLPNEGQLLAAFQACEDFWENNRATLKAAIDTALGFTTTAALARKLALAWLIWKIAKGG
jgi:hypothetical protein